MGSVVVGNSLRAGIYARVSTVEQAESGTSLATQIEHCRTHATSKGWSVVAEFVDEGVSGTSAQRPSLDAMFAAVHQGELDAVVVLRLDRFARSMRHLCGMIADLDAAGVQFVTVDGHFDTATSQGRLMRNILGSFAEFERDMIVERTSAGLRRVAADGYWPGGTVPYGWRLDRSAGRSRLVIDDQAADTLRLIITLIVDRGQTTGEVATHLNTMGITPPRADRWHHNMIRHLLSRTPLSGNWTYAKPRRGSQQPMGAPLDVPIPPVVDEQRHRQLLHTLARASTGPQPDTKRQFYLVGNGRLHGPCGGTFHGIHRRDRGYRQYRCGQSLHYIVNRCDCRRIFADDLEQRVWNAVKALFSSSSRLLALSRSGTSHEPRESPHAESETAQMLDAQIAQLDRAISRVAIEYAKADLPSAALAAASKELTEQRDTLWGRRQLVAQWAATRRRQRYRAQRFRHLAHLLRASEPNMRRHEQARLFAWLEVTVTITGWMPCPTCRQRGRIPGGRGGRTCPSCRGARQTPSLRIDGTLGEDTIEALIRYLEGTSAEASTNTARRRRCDPQPAAGAIAWTISAPSDPAPSRSTAT